jgi:predicted nucleic acid-binding Zn ribbon protein
MDRSYEVTRSAVEAAPEPVCVVCAARIAEFDACCSLSCVQEAAREVQRNLAVLRRLRLPDAPSETRLRLAERNGRLSSALLRWRPGRIDLVAFEGSRVQRA